MDPADLLGRHVGGWKLEAVIAAGAFGHVYRTRLPDHPIPRLAHLPREAPYALKLCQPIDSRDIRHGFQMELQALKSLEFENRAGIVTIHDYGFDGSLPYLVMDEQKESLDDLLRREGAIACHRAVELIDPVACTLSHAHDRGVRHRDVRPPNILIGFDGAVRLADFGIATLEAERVRLTPLGTIVGYPGYLSPEYLLGLPANNDSDLWMLTCCLYRMLAGRDPYPSSQHGRRDWGVVDQDAVPLLLHPFFKKAFAARLSDRYRNADEWREALSASSAPRTDRQPRPSRTEATPTSAHSLALVAVTVVLAMLLVILLTNH